MIKLWKMLTGKDGKENKVAIENASDKSLKIGESTLKISDLVKEFMDTNSVSLENEQIPLTAIVELPNGKEITVKELLESHLKNRKNMEDKETEERKKELGEEAKNAEDEEKKKKEKEDKEKMDNEAKAKEKEAEMENAHKTAKENSDHYNNAVENCGMCKAGQEGISHFNKLKNAAELRGKPQDIKVNVTSMKERHAMGKDRYGSGAKAA